MPYVRSFLINQTFSNLHLIIGILEPLIASSVASSYVGFEPFIKSLHLLLETWFFICHRSVKQIFTSCSSLRTADPVVLSNGFLKTQRRWMMEPRHVQKSRVRIWHWEGG